MTPDETTEPINHPEREMRVLFPQRVRTLFAQQPSFVSITNILGNTYIYETPNDQGYRFCEYEDGGRILRMAQYDGIIYPGLNGSFVSGLRGAWVITDKSMNGRENYLQQLRNLAGSETGSQIKGEKMTRKDAIHLLDEFGKVAKAYKFEQMVESKLASKQKLTPEESELKAKFDHLRSKMVGVTYDFPATTLLYLYEKGGLGWLWGITEQDSADQVCHKNQGGRVADIDYAHW